MCCLFIFLAFLGTMIALTIEGVILGDPIKLMAPYDGRSHFCGIDADVIEYPKLYLTKLGAATVSDIFASAVCVKECPDFFNPPATLEQGTLKTKSIPFPEPVYYSKEIMNFCFPDFTVGKYNVADKKRIENWKNVLQDFTNNPLDASFTDMYLSSISMYTSMFLAPIYILVFMYFMSRLANCMAWTFIILVQIGLFVMSFIFFDLYNTSIPPAGAAAQVGT